MLGVGQDGLLPQHVGQKDDKLYTTLKNPANDARAKDIMEKKGTSMFKLVSKSNTLHPAVALFVNLNFLPSLKNELMYRNDDQNGKVYSCMKVYSKPGSDLGHVKIFLTCRETRDNLLFRGGVNVFNTRPHGVEVDLNREVRRCCVCQGYGRVQANCRAKEPRCDKCSGAHKTNKCTSTEKKMFQLQRARLLRRQGLSSADKSCC
jgi:hypothetical protein